MTQVLLDPTDSASISINTAFGVISGDVNREPFPLSGPQIVQQATFTGRIIWGDVISITQNIHIHPNPMTQAEKEFLEQKEAFLGIPPLLLSGYQGQYIVSHDGEILDCDLDLPTLTARFFSTHGDIPVFITKIGEELEDRFDTPIIE